MPSPASRPAPVSATPEAAGGSGGRELEWQLGAADLTPVARWLERSGIQDGIWFEKRPPQEIHDLYLDTADWSIFRAGFALRIREKRGEAEATLKGLRSARSDLADRPEMTEPLARAELDALEGATGPVACRVRDVVGEQKLRRLFELRTSRQRYAVRRTQQESDIGEVALDETLISGGDSRHKPPLRRVEVEAFGEEACSRLTQLVEKLRTECGLERGAASKFALGVRAARLAPPALRQDGVVPILATMHIEEAARAALTVELADWRAHEPGARLGEDPEELHALRVAGRRIEATLASFTPFLPARLRQSRRKLKSLLGTLGEVRDLDVLLAGIDSFANRLPESQRGALAPLRLHGRAERARARTRMLRALNARTTRRWLERLSSLAERPLAAAVSRRGAPLATAVLPDLIRSRYRKLRKRARRLQTRSTMSDYHALRVRTKKLRYVLEMCASLYGRPAEEMLEALRRLQSKLGDQRDAWVITQALMRTATHPPAQIPTEAVFLMGGLAERHSRDAARMGRRIEKAWRKLEGRRWKALVARLEQLEQLEAARVSPANRVVRGLARSRGLNQDEA